MGEVPLAAAAEGVAPARDLDGLLGFVPSTPSAADGDSRHFWVMAGDGEQRFVGRRFRLAGSTEHFRVWAEDSTDLGANPMMGVAAELERSLRTGVTGTLWRATKARGISVGMIDVVFASLSGVGGYFTSADQPGSFASAYSNRANAIYVSEATCRLAVLCDTSTAVHELQHLLQYLVDPREQAWLSEALSETAERRPTEVAESRVSLLCSDFPFLRWPDDSGEVGIYYAASRDLLRFWTHLYGVSALDAVAVSPWQGPAAFDAYFSARGLEGGFDDVFLAWAAEQAAITLEGGSSDRRLRPVHGKCASSSTLRIEPPDAATDSVSPYGCDRVVLEGAGAVTLTFSGAATASPLPVEAHSGAACWWSGRANQSQATLTRELDLRETTEAHLSFWLWWDIETHFDWGYVAVSGDDGRTWVILKSEDTTGENPVGNCPGQGYTGASDGWRRQTVDLSEYTGSRVLLQFGYLTDDGVEYAGFAVDDVLLPEIGLSDDMESSSQWTALGFELVSAERPLAQRYGIRLVTVGADGYTSVPLRVGAGGEATWNLPAVVAGEQRALLVCGLTEAAAKPAAYTVVVAADASVPVAAN